MKLIQFLIECMYPRCCCGCQRIGSWLCPDCYEKIDPLLNPLPTTHVTTNLDWLGAVATYQSPIRELIHDLKYHQVKELGPVCARLLFHLAPIPQVDAVTAVPLHPRRQHERGFNQAEVIAQHLALLMDKPYLSLLQRTRHIQSQALSRNHEERVKKVEALFSMRRQSPKSSNEIPTATSLPPPHSILIIDDVITSGATFNSCAKTLKAAGCNWVGGLALAHGD
jgi:ComF family protein